MIVLLSLAQREYDECGTDAEESTGFLTGTKRGDMKNITITRRFCLDPLVLEPLIEQRVNEPGRTKPADKATQSLNREPIRKTEEFRPTCLDANHRFGKSHGNKRPGR